MTVRCLIIKFSTCNFIMEKEIDIQQIIACLTGNCSQKEQKLVEQWISMSSENALLYHELKLVWDSSSVENDSHIVDIEKAWSNFKTRTNFSEAVAIQPCVALESVVRSEVVKRNNIKKILYYSYRIAAFALVALGFYLLFDKEESVEINSFTTSIVQSDLPVILPDGSQIVLNKEARVDYPKDFAASTRQVNFSGDAFFDIAHNPEKPMIIATGNVRVKVLGTSFYLCNNVGSDDISVYLESGKIIFYSIDEVDGGILEQIVLAPGQKGNYNKNTGLISKQDFTNNNHIAWKTGQLEFDNTPLPEVLETLEANYDISVKSNIPIDNYKLTARFNNETPSSIFESLQTIYGFSFEIDDNNVSIY